jgi:endonuclease/exonuclease/phosphatase (EEP) superfamily protein YafD
MLVGLLGWTMILATALPLVRAEAWWIRIFDFPRLQILILAALAAAAYLPFLDGSTPSLLFMGALLASLAYQCFMMFPYTPFARKQVDDSKRASDASTVCLLFANVLMTNRDSGRLKALIRRVDPDLVLAVETDEWWRGELAFLKETHQYAVEHPRDNTYGMLLYSRLPLVDPQVRFLVEPDIPSIHARLRLRGDEEIELRCVHPRPPAPQEAQDSRPRDRELLVVGKEFAQKRVPVIVIGDLNDVAWSRTNYRFQKVSGLLDPRIGRGFFHTFHAKLPFIRYPLDHCFHSGHFRLVRFQRLEKFGSDHFPVCIRLSYEPEAAPAQDASRDQRVRERS